MQLYFQTLQWFVPAEIKQFIVIFREPNPRILPSWRCKCEINLQSISKLNETKNTSETAIFLFSFFSNKQLCSLFLKNCFSLPYWNIVNNLMFFLISQGTWNKDISTQANSNWSWIKRSTKRFHKKWCKVRKFHRKMWIAFW